MSASPMVTAPVVVTLAGDLPFVTAEHVATLVREVEADAGSTGAVYVDDTGREQWLCSAWRPEALRHLPLPPGTALRTALQSLPVRRIRPQAGGPQVWLDCDTPDDVRHAEELLR